MFRVIFHLDMDAFYASIEQRDNPSLRGKPVIVGSPPTQRGVVCAASYQARKLGVRSAMPSSTAGRLCPTGMFVRPRMDDYREESRKIMALVAQTGALIEQVSIDEAYLDLSEAVGRASRPTPGSDAPFAKETIVPAEIDDALYRAVPLARELKRKILSERGLTASIGIAANKLLAKLASDFSKPDGLTLVPERDKVLFLRPMPVRAIHGVGQVTEQALNRAGLRTVGDLQDYPGDLRALVGSFGPKLKHFAFGEDDRPLELGDEIKSISSEETFLRDTDDRPALRKCLREQAAEISGKLKRRRLAAKTVQVKIRYSDFTTLTRQVSVEEPIAEARDIYRLGCFLLAKEKLVSRPLRLIGLGVSGLGEATVRQLTLL
ncbi:MAG: DNA polymerase IV [Verrucomicrobia bacterium]|nr:MAG: DNA polymerase IV [Verrucomicrobiota bacterium]